MTVTLTWALALKFVLLFVIYGLLEGYARYRVHYFLNKGRVAIKGFDTWHWVLWMLIFIAFQMLNS